MDDDCFYCLRPDRDARPSKWGPICLACWIEITADKAT